MIVGKSENDRPVAPGPPLNRVSKQYHGRPHTARQFRTTKSPGATSVTPSPTDCTTLATSCPSRNGNSSLISRSRFGLVRCVGLYGRRCG